MSHDHADASLDELARRAAEGDREALSALVRDLQHPMYRLALLFLGHPDDAQDACQEILVRIVTRLGPSRADPSSPPGPTRSQCAACSAPANG